MFQFASWRRNASLTSVMAICASLSAADQPGRKAASGDSGVLERVSWHDDDKQSHEVAARVLVEAADGGLLLVGQDGRLWTVEKPQLVSRQETGESFRPLSAGALGKQLQSELGAGFDVVTTKHYVICTSAKREY